MNDKIEFRDRVVGFERIPADQLIDNPKNWRKHPDRQRTVLQNVLREIGFVGAVLVRKIDDGYELLDGHLRKDLVEGGAVPAVITDLNDEEMEILLATYDPITEMAVPDQTMLESILHSAHKISGESLRHSLEEVGSRFGIKLGYDFDDEEPPNPTTSEFDAVQLIVQIQKNKYTDSLGQRIREIAEEVDGKFLVKGE